MTIRFMTIRQAMRAQVLSRCTVGVEPCTPEDVVHDDDLSVEAVQDAIEDGVRHYESVL